MNRPTKPVASVKEALQLIGSFDGDPEQLELAVPEVLIDPVGLNMAIITDHVLARGWQPDGFIQETGYRIYRYKKLGP